MSVNDFFKVLAYLLDEHKLVRRFVMLWVLILSSIAFYIVFFSGKLDGEQTYQAYRDTIALLAVAVGFYTWSRK
jgi:hypothetical protein